MYRYRIIIIQAIDSNTRDDVLTVSCEKQHAKSDVK
jgi:hypothetical protein